MKTYGRKSRGRQKYDTSLNFDLVCRLCLSEDGEMRDLFQEDEPAATPVTLKIMGSVSLAVFENDGLPTQVCQNCLEHIEKFYLFKQKCEEADLQLRKVLKHRRLREKGEVVEEEEEPKDADEVDPLHVASTSKSATINVKAKQSSQRPVRVRLPVQEHSKSMDELLMVCEKQRGDSQVSSNYVIDVGDLDDKTSDSTEAVSYDIDLPSEASRPDNVTQSDTMIVTQRYEMDVEEQEMEEHYLEVERLEEGDDDEEQIVIIRRMKREVEEGEEEEAMEEYGNGNQAERKGERLLFPFECLHCTKRFNKRIDLRRHLSVHQDKKADGLSQGFDCPVCDKWFPNTTTLRRHERSHTGERPFACGHCDKKFSQAGILQRHVMTHTGFKPFTCDVCPKGFTQREGLKVHLRTHAPKNPEEISLHECPLCEKSFCHPSGLSRHLLVHTGKTFNCDTCPKTFTDPSSLRRHVKRHGEDKPGEAAEESWQEEGEVNA